MEDIVLRAGDIKMRQTEMVLLYSQRWSQMIIIIIV